MNVFCNRIKLICLVFCLSISISIVAISQPRAATREELIEEIRKIEKEFENDLNKMGAAFAFEKYAAPGAVIKRDNDSLVTGSMGIKHYYSGDIYRTAKAVWSPDYIDVSKDGTMAYTYGKYRWTMSDKSGKTQEYAGVFHTVWKKQADGTWKYVWD